MQMTRDQTQSIQAFRRKLQITNHKVAVQS